MSGSPNDLRDMLVSGSQYVLHGHARITNGGTERVREGRKHRHRRKLGGRTTCGDHGLPGASPNPSYARSRAPRNEHNSDSEWTHLRFIQDLV